MRELELISGFGSISVLKYFLGEILQFRWHEQAIHCQILPFQAQNLKNMGGNNE